MDMKQRILASMWAHLFLLVGGIHCGLIGLTSWSPLTWLADKVWAPLATIVFVLVGASAVYLMLQRDYYLPFLGQAAFPCGSLVEKYPQDANATIVVEATPQSNVIFWAAEQGKSDEVAKNPWVAYQKYSNAGVAKADLNGRATLRFRKPMSYYVPSGKTLVPHVHYRECLYNGMLSPVKTVNV